MTKAPIAIVHKQGEKMRTGSFSARCSGRFERKTAMDIKQVLCGLAAALIGWGAPVTAAVSPEEADKLRSELTPLGAERAGNKDGTIPAWTGGYTTVPPGYRSGQPRPDPFANEKPLFQISAANVDRYADKLADGVKILLTRFPGYRMDVYRTHRTAAAPQWVYDNTYKNATRAKATAGPSVEGAYGGIPFPIPTEGVEAMWNHLLAWKGEAIKFDLSNYVVSGGQPVLTTAAMLDAQYPYYDQNAALENFNGIYSRVKTVSHAPPVKVGESMVGYDSVDQVRQGRKNWQYLVGQRRVRRAPDVGYDTPNFYSSGFSVLDEGWLFNGPLDRYDWKLLGKREMVVPYNTQRFHTTPVDQALGPTHLNPDHVRWELHRVWVVEARLAPGKRHVMPTRRFYLDEDTWLTVLAESWDAGGQLWHIGYSLPLIVPELPGVIAFPYVIYDLLKGGYETASLFNGQQRHYQIVPRRPEDYFSPDVLAAEGIR
jgi:hypothetical protein